jgi:hypothetical protein
MSGEYFRAELGVLERGSRKFWAIHDDAFEDGGSPLRELASYGESDASPLFGSAGLGRELGVFDDFEGAFSASGRSLSAVLNEVAEGVEGAAIGIARSGARYAEADEDLHYLISGYLRDGR